MPSLNLGPADYERALEALGLSGVRVFHRRTTGSTNDDARQIVSSRLPIVEGAVAIVVAETQTSGRGRGTNTWASPPGSVSLTITAPGVEARRLSVLPLGAGACVAEAIRSLGAPAVVKWPNDILIDSYKVCGILCESSLLGETARVFIGVGINVDAGLSEEQAGSPATTLANHGLVVDRPSLVADVTSRVLAMIRDPSSNEQVVARWKALAAPWWGQEVDLKDGAAERRVTLLDVNPEGQLVVRDETGVVRSLVSGEVRKLRTAHA